MNRFEERLLRLRAELAKTEAEAFYVTGAPNVAYFTGKKGNDCALYVTQYEAFIITDFRYREMAQELSWLTFWEWGMGRSTYDFINLRPEKTIGVEKDRLPLSVYLDLLEKCPEKKIVPLKLLWRQERRPPRNSNADWQILKHLEEDSLTKILKRY